MKNPNKNRVKKRHFEKADPWTGFCQNGQLTVAQGPQTKVFKTHEEAE
jgi:hypothetical protein